jgi:hypothetical protein
MERTIKKLISDRDLQTHIHHIGLMEFLKQLEEVFSRAHDDLESINHGTISGQYETAKYHITAMREELFPESDYEL